MSICLHTSFRYFEFRPVCACGLPSVTLAGEQPDWQKLLDRTTRLAGLGPEPARWAAMLRPVLQRFSNAFAGTPDMSFWTHVVHFDPTFYGADDLSGWLSVFCVWSNTGKWQPQSLPAQAGAGAGEGSSASRMFSCVLNCIAALMRDLRRIQARTTTGASSSMALCTRR